MWHNEYFHMQPKGLSMCSQSKLFLSWATAQWSYIEYQATVWGFFLELKLDSLSWKSEVKVPAVEKKLIWVCISGHTVIQFSFQLYFYLRKFLWKISGSLIVNWSVCQRACFFFWSWALSAACFNADMSDQSRATGFKQKNTRPKQFPEGNGGIVQCVEKYVMANPIDGAPSGVINGS